MASKVQALKSLSTNTASTDSRIFADFLDNCTPHDNCHFFPDNVQVWIATSATFESSKKTIKEINSLEVKSSSSAESEKKYSEEVLDLVYRLESHNESRLAARQLMISIEETYRCKAYSKTNSIIKNADLTKLKDHAIVGLVRSTAIMHKNLSGWIHLYQVASEILENNGKKPELLFIGLPQKRNDS